MSENKLYILEIQKGFSKRLNKLLCEKGCCSKSPEIGSAKILSQVADCSIPMARRYLLGKGIPGTSRLEKIAQWAGVSTNWLIGGNQLELFEINENLLSEIFIELFSQISYSNIDNRKIREYILFSINVYKKISKLTSNDKDKAEFAKIMIQSIHEPIDTKFTSVIGFN